MEAIERTEIRDFVLDAMKINKKKREHYARAIDFALTIQADGVDPKTIAVGKHK